MIRRRVKKALDGKDSSLLGGDVMRADNPISAWIAVMTLASYAWVLALRSTPVTGSDPTSTI